MSLAVPPMPPEGWCIITRACGVAYRLPGVPALRRNWPIEAAIPIATVATSLGTHCMVSKIAMPAVTDPPGLLMYSQMSLVGSSAARRSICAQIAFALSSRTSEPRKMIRSLSRRL